MEDLTASLPAGFCTASALSAARSSIERLHHRFLLVPVRLHTQLSSDRAFSTRSGRSSADGLIYPQVQLLCGKLGRIVHKVNSDMV